MRAGLLLVGALAAGCNADGAAGTDATSSTSGSGGKGAGSPSVSGSSGSSGGGAHGAIGGAESLPAAGKPGAGSSFAEGGVTAAGGRDSEGGRAGSAGTAGGGGRAMNAGGNEGTAGASAGSGAGGRGGTEGGAAGGPAAGMAGIAGMAGTAGTADPPAPYQGPCDVLKSGCAEAYGVTRAQTATYTGPLFQLGRSSDKQTLDIGQTSEHTVDMTTWSAFCSASESKCVISKIYAQIHQGDNDLVPGVFNAPWGPNCSAGGYTCAAKFTIEKETGLPIITTTSPQEYSLSGDKVSVGVNGGSKSVGIMFNGKPVNSNYCCGVFGITHKYSASDTYGTDFMLVLAKGWKDNGGNGVGVNCGSSNNYCIGAEEEEQNDLFDYGSSPVANAVVVTQFDASSNTVTSFLNGAQKLSHSPPKAKINAGTCIHLGGGGDLSQPDPVLMREAILTNNVMTASEVTALKDNVTAFYPALKFP